MACKRFVKKRIQTKEDTKEDHPQQLIKSTTTIKEANNKEQYKNEQEKKYKNKLKIIYTNATLTALKKQELKELVSRSQPHIIAVCEVKPKNGKERLIQDYSFDGYSVPYQTNAINRTGRGIIILVHKSLSHHVLHVNATIKYEEVCLLEIKLENNDLLIFGCIYRSPTETVTSDENNSNLNLLLRQISSNNKYTHKCIVGDFNYKAINWEHWSTSYGEASKEEQFLEALRNSFLYQHVKEPTRARGTDEPSTIDLILTGEQFQVSNLCYIAPLGKSDHSVLSFTFDCYFESELSTERYNYHKDFNERGT